jgi:hypothetical protein
LNKNIFWLGFKGFGVGKERRYCAGWLVGGKFTDKRDVEYAFHINVQREKILWNQVWSYLRSPPVVL